MKILSIQTTILPDGQRIQWVNGMPKHYTRELHTNQFNYWHQYITAQVNKAKGINKVRPGGVAHIEGQMAVLRSIKEILK